MDTQKHIESNDVEKLAEAARELLTATAGLAGEKVGEARQRVTAALERGKEMCGRVREKAVEGARAADEVVHKHPYEAIAVALALGGIVGYLLAHRCSCSRNRD